ncbi:MAG: response regulator [Bdellovibrio sp.]|nr:response regulator [Bdellovibrio sp.]
MKQGSLLVIDDEVQILDGLSMFLEDVAEKIIVVDSGIKALEVLKHQQVDCIVCDVKMPGMDGLEVIKEVRALGLETPFIFFTAFGSEKTIMEAVKYGAFDFISKPKFEALLEIVSHGLKAGIKMRCEKTISTDEVIKEYQELIRINK